MTMVVPVLFDDWCKVEGRSKMRLAYQRLANIGLGLGVLTFVVGYPFVEPVTLLLFGSAYLPSVTSTLIMLGSVYALFLTRLLTAALFALGKPNIIAAGAVSRLLVVGALLMFFDHTSLTVAAISWVCGEYLGMVLMGAHLRTKFGWSLAEIFGYSFKAGKTV